MTFTENVKFRDRELLGPQIIWYIIFICARETVGVQALVLTYMAGWRGVKTADQS